MTQKPATDPATPPDQDAMPLKELARAILDRAIRPRTSAVRRLAEAVLGMGEGKSGKKADKKKKGSKKARKLATIPGQKAKKPENQKKA
jgi:hypothetical protein